MTTSTRPMRKDGRRQCCAGFQGSVGWRIKEDILEDFCLPFFFLSFLPFFFPSFLFSLQFSKGLDSLNREGLFPTGWLSIWVWAICSISFGFPFSSVRISHSVVSDSATPGAAARQVSLSITAHHQFLELAQTHVHQFGDTIQPSLSSPSLPAFNLSQHQGLFHWVSSSHHVARVLELQLQHQPLQWIFRTNFL